MPPHEAPSGLGRLQLQLSPDPGAPAEARRALRTLPLGMNAEDALLLASELVTNAVVHAGGPIELTADCAGGCTRIEVRDHGPGFAFRPPREGYGLQMLAHATQRWGIAREGDSTAVWFELEA